MFSQLCRGRAWQVPKAEATGLAPLRIGDPRVSARGFPFWIGNADPGGDALELRLWAYDAEMAGRLARRTKMDSITEDFPQRRAGAIEESLHPVTLASRIVIFADRFANRRRGRSQPSDALGDVYIAALVASF